MRLLLMNVCLENQQEEIDWGIGELENPWQKKTFECTKQRLGTPHLRHSALLNKPVAVLGGSGAFC